MSAELTAYLPLILIGLVALVLIVWLLARMNRKARLITEGDATPLARDVLAEGAAPAPRNQALIDAPPAAVKAEPAPAPAPAPTPADSADDLTRIKGLGPKIASLLGELGVTHYAQIAAWSDDDIARIDAQLGRFAGRITRDQWVAQAKLLAAGDETAFVSQFGQNG